MHVRVDKQSSNFLLHFSLINFMILCRYYQRIGSVTFYPAKPNHLNTLPVKDAMQSKCKTREFMKNAFNNRIWELGRINVLNICELHFMIFFVFLLLAIME